MNDFDYDVLQRKRLAQQAKYKKNGSKSKKCTLPCDGMTKKQLERMNGEVMTYNLNQAMTYSEFCKMPTDLQKKYMTKLVDSLHMSGYDFARMFGVSQTTVVKTAKIIGVSLKGGKKTNEQKQAVARFIGGETGIASIDTHEPTKPDEPSEPEPQQDNKATADMRISSFTVCYDGAFDSEAICRSICALVPAGTHVSVEIKCTTEQEE